MRGKVKFTHRLISLLLCVALLAAYIPLSMTAASAAEGPTKVADASTQDIWESIVSGNQSTQYLGRVWTDKTVATTTVGTDGNTYGVSLEYKLDASSGTTQTQHINLLANEYADFQIALSAVSSTASYVETQSVLLPLDIVLVLDVSGSMNDNMDYIYEVASDNYNTNSTYYVLVDGEYIAVSYSRWNGYFYTGDGYNQQTYYPAAYTIYTRVGVSRLDTLKSAVNTFLTKVKELNAAIPTTGAKHQVSIITFAGSGSARTRQDLTSNIDSAINTVNNLTANGGTYPDEGLELAIDQLENARAIANKYVLFFTDGTPGGVNSSGNANEFGEDTAAKSVEFAKTLKNTYNATIFSIAVLESATAAELKKPTISTSNNQTTVDGESVIDYMMHAISSNYPDATASYTVTGNQSGPGGGGPGGGGNNQTVSWTLTLGNRTEESNYYFATTNAAELESIFTEIADNVTSSGTGSATHISGNDSSADGYVTLVDELGDYMELKSLDAITIEGEVYYFSAVGTTAATSGDGYTETQYIFTKEVDLNTTLEARKAGTTSTENLADIIIIERDYTDPAARDTLTVQIPAALLPLRYYSVDEAGNLTIKETLPVRVVYSVGLLDAVRTAVATGAYSTVNGLAAYVAAHTDSTTGKISFYSNYFDGVDSNNDGYTDGNTYSTFAPAQNNGFYYYTEDTPFLDADHNPIASTGDYEADLAGTVYYAHEYYQLNGTTTEKKTEYIGLSIDAAIKNIGITWAEDDISKYIGIDADGNYYMKKGFAKLSLANDTRFIEDKGTGNNTATATTVLNPSWSYNISPDQTIGTDYANYKTMNYLGNNGRITYAGLGSLTITKTVNTTDPMLTPGTNSFEFTVTLSSAAAAGTYDVTHVGATDPIENVTFTASGTTATTTVTLKNGETLTINGLPNGVTWTVEENTAAGFTATYRDNDGTAADGSGTITTGGADVVDVLNTYSVHEITATFDLDGLKTLVYNDNNPVTGQTHTFKFYLQAWNNTETRWEYVKADGKTTTQIDEAVYATATYNDTTTRGAAIDFTAIDGALSQWKFSTVGIYSFRIIEANSGLTREGIYHDDTVHSFEVNVVDNGQGALVVDSVTSAHDTTNNWTLVDNTWTNDDVNFTNISGTTKLTIPIDKAIHDSTGNGYDNTSGYQFNVQHILSGNDTMDITALGAATNWSEITTTAATAADGIAHFGMEYITNTGAAPGTIDSEGRHVYPAAAGTYYEYYKITENTDAPKAQITYDTSVYYVEVKIDITANNAGGYTVAVDYSIVGRTDATDKEIVFVNTYSDSETLTLGASKVLTGRGWKDGDSFTFTLTPTQYTKDGVTMGKVFHLEADGTGYKAVAGAATGVKPTATATSAAVALFGDITFTEIGNYFFTVTETAGNIPGVSYDTTPHYIMVAVTVDDNHQLQTAVYSYKLGALTAAGGVYNVASITNTYTPNPVKVTLGGKKTLENKTLAANTFAFLLRDDTNTVVDAQWNGADGTYTFDTLTFDKAGTYIYTVTEYNNNLAGVAYDATAYTITVNVTDPGDGQLQASVLVNGDLKASGSNLSCYGLNFTNTYTATGSLLIPVTKTISGRDWKEGDSFTFALYDEDPATNPQAKDVVTLTIAAPEDIPKGIQSIRDTFAPIEYTQADVGTHTYYILEQGQDANGITVDITKYTMTVTVTDNGDGTLKIDTALTDGTNAHTEIGFINTYEAASVQLTIYGKKVLKNRPLAMKEGEFTFTLTAITSDAPMPEVAQASNAADGRFSFPELTFTAAGEYQYKVTEVNAGQTIDGVTYSTQEYIITVVVTDDLNGQLKANITSDHGNNDSPALFTNTYIPAPHEAVIHGDKILTNLTPGVTNTNMTVGAGDFTFKLEAITSGAPMPAVTEVSNDADSDFTFGPIKFTATGIYEYKVTEVIPAEKLPGVTYSTQSYTVTIEVTDDSEGHLTATVTGVGAVNNPVTFTNTYKAEATVPVVIGGDKILTGRPTDLKDGEFSFVLKDAAGDPVETMQNVDGKFTFTGLTFDTVGSYTYTVSEVKGNVAGVTYDETVYTVIIDVIDGGAGQLITGLWLGEQETNEEDLAALTFTNTYKAAPTTAVLEAEKLLTDITSGGDAALTPTTGAFSFTLKDSTGKVLETVQNNGKKVTFTAIGYDKAGVYTYTITEVKGDLAGIGYDTAVITATVTVTDDGNGALKAVVAYDKTPQFSNTYTAPDATLILAGQKALTGGRDLKDGEFSFNLKGNGIDVTVKNGADGKFAFPALTFNKTGTYTYEITEVRGSDTQVTYDTAKYTVTVTVTYENGAMTAKATVEGKTVDSYGFTNIFTPDPVPVEIPVQKILQNLTDKPMGLDGFQFRMVGNGLDVTATSDAAGIAKFTLTFDKVGTYTYEVTEVKGSVAGMTYDETVQTVKITVTQDPTTGALKATVEGKIAFTNILADQPPKTGDDFNLTALVLMMSLSLVCMVAVLTLGKKQTF